MERKPAFTEGSPDISAPSRYSRANLIEQETETPRGPHQMGKSPPSFPSRELGPSTPPPLSLLKPWPCPHLALLKQSFHITLHGTATWHG